MGYPVDVVGTAGDDDLSWAMDQDWDLNGKDDRQVILGMGGNDRVNLGAPASGDPDWVFFCGGRGKDFAGGIHGFNGGHGKDTMERYCFGRAKSVERFIENTCREVP
jgi:hypothetical protein